MDENLSLHSGTRPFRLVMYIARSTTEGVGVDRTFPGTFGDLSGTGGTCPFVHCLTRHVGDGRVVCTKNVGLKVVTSTK